MSDSPILADLNPAQKEAVTWPATPLLILAGAGSGKTRILTRRIAWLLNQGVPGFQVLGVTFTNKAAQEMKLRVSKLVRQEVWVSTFHATCLRILRMDGQAMGLDRNFTIYDDQDQLIIIKECLRELKIDEKQVHPKAVRERISRAKDVLMTPIEYREKSVDLYEEVIGKVYTLYEEKLERLKACDFGDLIFKTVSLFDKYPAVLKSWQDRFHHVLIDEYQDTNHAQYRLVKLLAQARRQVTVVGDPDQSIYAWRGADIKNILNFENDYPECGIIRMEQNYRSTSIILESANALIENNEIRKPKNLWTEKKGGERISLFEANDEKEEALYVAQQILEYRRTGKTLADQVVFYRVHAQSRIIEDLLRRFNIPYKIVGGTRFYDRKEIKDLIAYLRAVAFPHDDVSLKRILNVPPRGIGKKAEEILEHAGQGGKISFDEVLKNAGSLEALTPKTRKTIAVFHSFLTALRKEIKNLSVAEILERILEKSRYVAELETEKTTEAQARIENIEEFFSVIEDFENQSMSSPMSFPNANSPSSFPNANSLSSFPDSFAGNPQPSTPLHAFIESISLMTNLDTWEAGTDILTLMTLHTAKGLEFPIVYMVGLEEGIFPNINSYTDSPDDIEEERRLCYVGLTRAKDKLHISYARQRRLYGTMQQNLPSRFLNEIPREFFQPAGYFQDEVQNPHSELEDEVDIDFDSDTKKRRILFD